MSPETTQAIVKRMIEHPGMYLVTIENGAIPLWSQDHKIFSLKIDQELAAEGFHCVTPLVGPLVPAPLHHAAPPIDTSVN